MKIVFLCGSLEPGRDGVGDYSRRLAAEFIRQGHEATIVALHDRFVESAKEEEQSCGNCKLGVLRIAAHDSDELRVRLAENWVRLQHPDWVSLQFVPFSFQEKGLPFNLKKLLQKIVQGRQVHVMFHELWVVRDLRISMKLWLIGTIQRQIITILVKSLKPLVIHTQTQLYQNYLHRQGFRAEHLPLFSNIPLAVQHRSGVDETLKEKKKISFVVFGSIHPNSLFELFAKEVKEYALSTRTDVTLVFIGRSGSEQLRWKAIWNSMELHVKELGEQPEEVISAVLTEASIGLTTTPYALVEKSGTVAAMLEHGLPVLCIAKPWKPAGTTKSFSIRGITEYKSGVLPNYLMKTDRFAAKSRIEDVSLQLIESFRKSAKRVVTV